MDIRLIKDTDNCKCSMCLSENVKVKYVISSDMLHLSYPVCNKCIVRAKSKMYDMEHRQVKKVG